MPLSPIAKGNERDQSGNIRQRRKLGNSQLQQKRKVFIPQSLSDSGRRHIVAVLWKRQFKFPKRRKEVHPVNGEVPPVKGRPWKLPHYVNRGKTTSSGGEMASARSCFSTVRTALGKLRITGLPAPFDVARSFPQFLRPLPLQPTVLTSKRRSRFGIRKAPNHVPPPHLPDDPEKNAGLASRKFKKKL